MWTPKQLLRPQVVQALRESGRFPEPLIEFLGWNNGRAKRLNGNPNPVKCALTMLRDSDDNANTQKWLKVFLEKKRDSLKPQVDTSMHKALKVARQVEELEKDAASNANPRLAELPWQQEPFAQALLDGE